MQDPSEIYASCLKGFSGVFAEKKEFSLALKLVEKLYFWFTIQDKSADAWFRTIEDQVARASTSTVCNCAEAHGRGSIASIIQFMKICRGSAYEVNGILLAIPSSWEFPKEVLQLSFEVCKLVDKSIIDLLGGKNDDERN